MGLCISRFGVMRDPKQDTFGETYTNYKNLELESQNSQPPLSCVGDFTKLQELDSECFLAYESTNEGLPKEKSLPEDSENPNCIHETKVYEIENYLEEIKGSLGWKVIESGDFEVQSLHGSMWQDSIPIVQLKIDLNRNISRSVFQELIVKPQVRRRWDPFRKDMHNKAALASFLYIQEYTYLFPLKNRVFCEKVNILEHEKEVSIISYSTGNPHIDNSVELGENVFTVVKLIKKNGESTIQVTSQVDFKLGINEKSEAILARGLVMWGTQLLKILDTA